MSPLEVLIAARDLIADKKRWTRGTFAQTARGTDCGARNPNAVRWCATGALDRVSEGQEQAEAYLRLHGCSEGLGIVATNDDKGHAATLAMFDRAISAERAKEAKT